MTGFFLSLIIIEDMPSRKKKHTVKSFKLEQIGTPPLSELDFINLPFEDRINKDNAFRLIKKNIFIFQYLDRDYVYDLQLPEKYSSRIIEKANVNFILEQYPYNYRCSQKWTHNDYQGDPNCRSEPFSVGTVFEKFTRREADLSPEWVMNSKVIGVYPVTNSLTNDDDIALYATFKKEGMFKFVGEKLKKKPEFIKKILSKFSKRKKNFVSIMKYCPPEIQNNRKIAKMAVKKCPEELDGLPSFQNDPEIVKLAIKGQGDTIMYASEELRSNQEIASLSLISDFDSIIYLSPRIQGNKELILSCFSNNKCNNSSKSNKLKIMSNIYSYDVKLPNGEVEEDVNLRLILQKLNYYNRDIYPYKSLNQFSLIKVERAKDLSEYDLVHSLFYNQNLIEPYQEGDKIYFREDIYSPYDLKYTITKIKQPALELMNESEIVLYGISPTSDIDRQSLIYASPLLRADSNLGLKACEINLKSFEYLESDLQENPEFIKNLLSSSKINNEDLLKVIKNIHSYDLTIPSGLFGSTRKNINLIPEMVKMIDNTIPTPLLDKQKINKNCLLRIGTQINGNIDNIESLKHHLKIGAKIEVRETIFSDWKLYGTISGINPLIQKKKFKEDPSLSMFLSEDTSLKVHNRENVGGSPKKLYKKRTNKKSSKGIK